MSLNVTLELPTEVEAKLRGKSTDLEADVRETYALELFRRGMLSHNELGQVLRRDRLETDAFLQRHGVTEGSLSMADLEADEKTLDRVTHPALNRSLRRGYMDAKEGRGRFV